MHSPVKSEDFYEAYGKLANHIDDSTLISGRYKIQAEFEKHIFPDVAVKLDLNKADVFLDIGCGLGLNLIPASKTVASATGIDHPAIISRTEAAFNDPQVQLIGGRFPDAMPHNRFDKILCYSVLNCLPNMEAVHQFIDAARSLLKPGGRALFGDLPNADRKRRFAATEFGQKFLEEWSKKVDDQNLVDVKQPSVDLDDARLLELVSSIRKDGDEAFLLPQPSSLPFGHTREDLLIIRRFD